jgi:CRP/FNR family transcriptional regulator
LPAAGTTQYGRGQLIYGRNTRSKGIYLVVAGSVGISQTTEDGSEVLLEIVPSDELFGESAFLDVFRRSERAVALEKTELMTWAISDMEKLIMERPRLALALLQVLAQRNAESARRIESFSLDSIEQRLARSLVRLSDRLGTPLEDGSVRMMPLTHVMLSRYIGTSREVVTQYMTRFRKRGYVTYSRQEILLHRAGLSAVYASAGAASLPSLAGAQLR